MMKKLFLWIAAFALLLTGCATPNPTPLPELTTVSTQPPPTATAFQPVLATPTIAQPTATVIPTATPRVLPERVLIITVDGLRPDAINQFDMPNVYTLMQQSMFALDAHTTLPSATLPSHASMLTGMCPEKHGVNWNDYIPANGFANGPSIFELAHNAGLRTVMVVGKEKLRQLTQPEYTDEFHYVNDRDRIVAERALPLMSTDFDLMFVHLPLVDLLGHAYGWMSPDYMTGVYRADEAIGMLLTALDEAGIRQGTLILITSDHGGHETSHGSSLLEDVSIPWILTGSSQNSGAIPRKLSTVDTAATIAYALDLSIPENWDGIPVYEAFGEPAPIRLERPCE